MLMHPILQELKETVTEAGLTTFELLKILIPVSIIVKILQLTGVITLVGSALAPVMKYVGLPGEYGLVWATAMITNIYGGLVVFFHLAQENILSVAQVTVLAVMILLAHSLPVEARITQKAGVRLWFMLLLRIGSAYLLGGILFLIFSVFQVLQYPSVLVWRLTLQDPSLFGWIVGEVRTYLLIFLIILVLVLLMRVLKKTGAIETINRMLAPGLKHLGIGKEAAPIAMIGITLGLSYGGGLIIREAKNGVVSKKDAFSSLCLMGLSHSLIEDTLLMLAIGASLSGVLVARVIFTLLIMFLLIRSIHRLSHRVFETYFTSSGIKKR